MNRYVFSFNELTGKNKGHYIGLDRSDFAKEYMSASRYVGQLYTKI